MQDDLDRITKSLLANVPTHKASALRVATILVAATLSGIGYFQVAAMPTDIAAADQETLRFHLSMLVAAGVAAIGAIIYLIAAWRHARRLERETTAALVAAAIRHTERKR